VIAKVTRAASWQQRGDVVRRISDDHRRAIKQAVLDAVRNFRKTMDLEAFKDALRRGSRDDAKFAFPVKRYADALRKAFERIAQCYEDAAASGALQVHNLTLHTRRRRLGKDRPGHGGVYAFDRFTPAVQEALRVLQDAFISDLSSEAADAVEQAIIDGATEGLTVDEIAASIRDVIGLNRRQAQAIDNYRANLESNRSDLDPSAIDAMVEDYVDRSLDYRAAMIAQTESIRAANLGLHDGYLQAVDRGVFPQEAVRRHWQIALDEKTCPICLAIPDQNEDGVAVDEAFETDEGPIMNPPVHPNCRCSVTYITNLDLVDEDQGADDEQLASS
jgi:hypothetical protein